MENQRLNKENFACVCAMLVFYNGSHILCLRLWLFFDCEFQLEQLIVAKVVVVVVHIHVAVSCRAPRILRRVRGDALEHALACRARIAHATANCRAVAQRAHYEQWNARLKESAVQKMMWKSSQKKEARLFVLMALFYISVSVWKSKRTKHYFVPRFWPLCSAACCAIRMRA